MTTILGFMSTRKSVAMGALLVSVGLIVGCGKGDAPDHVEWTKPNGKKTTDLKAVEDGVSAFQVLGGQPVPAKAEQLHREARAKGESGDYSSALTLLRQASEIAPDWAYPHYDMAFTYLLQGDSTNSLLKYREVDRLEPKGFFTTKTALWTLEREEKGIFPRGTYLDFIALEWIKPQERRAVIDQMITNIPAFAPAWKARALLMEGTDQRLASFEKALSLDPDPETYGICVLNKATELKDSGKSSEARLMLEELVQSDTSTRSTKLLAKEVLKTFKK